MDNIDEIPEHLMENIDKCFNLNNNLCQITNVVILEKTLHYEFATEPEMGCGYTGFVPIYFIKRLFK
jgi:hypothetical protein